MPISRTQRREEKVGGYIWWVKGKLSSTFFLKSQWTNPPVLASRTAELRNDPKSWISHFLTTESATCWSWLSQGFSAVGQSDIRSCLSTAGAAVLTEAHGTLEAWRDPQQGTAFCLCYYSDPSPDHPQTEDILHCKSYLVIVAVERLLYAAAPSTGVRWGAGGSTLMHTSTSLGSKASTRMAGQGRYSRNSGLTSDKSH